MRNQAIISVFATVFLHASLAGGVVAFSSWGDGDDDRDERKIMTIEAALAYKSDKPSDQPQKQRKRKRKKARKKPTEQAGKVAPGPTDKPSEPKRTEPEPEPDFAKQFEQYRDQRQESDDESDDTEWEESDTDVAPAGTFDGSKHGFAEVSRGDPYMQKLAADVYEGWELTTLEKSAGAAIGCVRLAADGSILAVDLWKKHETNSNLNLSVENALTAAKKQRKPGDAPVPAHLMDATTQWTCFKFSVAGL